MKRSTYEAMVEELFWDWYMGNYVETWTKAQRTDLNDLAKRRAAVLGITFVLDKRLPYGEGKPNEE